MKKKTVATLVAGTAIGAGLGVLFAPKSGKETRQDLKNKITEIKEHLENVKVKDVKKYVEGKIEKLENDLKALDKETVLKAAKNQAKKIEVDCKKLARYVKDKSEPILEEAVDSLREKAIDVTKHAIEKLENK